jgi:hypothetical protein
MEHTYSLLSAMGGDLDKAPHKMLKPIGKHVVYVVVVVGMFWL